MEIVGGGTLIAESLLARAELNAKWLLIDFGERSATRAAAREKLMMANVGFNGTHQKIVFDVTDRFYQLGTARQKVMVTQSALEAAKTVEQAAQARFDTGLATKPELLQAQQQSAQSNFDLEASRGAESDARVALIESIGLLPTVSLKVADLPKKSHLNAQPEDSVGDLITKALAQRPDLVAKLANVRSKEYEIREIRAEYYPKVTLDAHASETELDVSVANSDFFGGARPTFGVSLNAEVPIFDGFARRHKLDMAEADLHQAENELAGARDSAAREVWKTYTDYRTALKKQDAAEKLLTASKSAFDAVLDSYKQGLSTYTEVVTAERNLTAALATSHDTRTLRCGDSEFRYATVLQGGEVSTSRCSHRNRRQTNRDREKLAGKSDKDGQPRLATPFTLRDSHSPSIDCLFEQDRFRHSQPQNRDRPFRSARHLV